MSQELQLYYEKTTEAILAGDEKLQNVVYTSLAEDPGLHQLVPYLTQFISEQVREGGGVGNAAYFQDSLNVY